MLVDRSTKVVARGDTHACSEGLHKILFVCRAVHEKDEDRVSRTKFYYFALLFSLSWYAIPGFFFTTLSSVSWLCWVFPKSVIAQQIGSGMSGLGVGALTFDWAAVT